MIIELEINGARVIISGENLSVNVSDGSRTVFRPKHSKIKQDRSDGSLEVITTDFDAPDGGAYLRRLKGGDVSVSVTQAEAQSLGKITDFMLPSPAQIKSLRKSLHESQASFAKRFGVAQATVCRWERGDEKPSGPATLLLKRLMSEVAE